MVKSFTGVLRSHVHWSSRFRYSTTVGSFRKQIMKGEDIAFWLFLLAMIFLFEGTPDVWDRLHAAALGIGCNP